VSQRPEAARPRAAGERSRLVDGTLRPGRRRGGAHGRLAYTEGAAATRACGSARGAPRFAERHVRRLVRGAQALGLPAADPRRLRRALEELAKAAFFGGEGVVAALAIARRRRRAARRRCAARPWRGSPAWRAVTAPLPHPGALLAGRHKLTQRLLQALASDAARAAGAEEALLFDAAGYLVEGRSHERRRDAGGRRALHAADRARRGRGIALEVASERLPARCGATSRAATCFAARGVAVINAVRGARAGSRSTARRSAPTAARCGAPRCGIGRRLGPRRAGVYPAAPTQEPHP